MPLFNKTASLKREAVAAFSVKKIILGLVLSFFFSALPAQELYVFTEPASNMPSNTITPKISNNIGNRPYDWQRRYTSEIMFGISKKLMIHAGSTFSNMHTQKVKWESVYLYSKYRFLSNDDVHKHFRMAVFAEGSYSKNPLYFDEINFNGDVSGLQGGLVATQLVNKLAFSASTSYLHVLHKKGTAHEHEGRADKAVNYSVSAGYLVLPREYRDYNQLNLNIYTELLGQQTLGIDRYYIDAAPAIQLIFNSNSKVNFGYRFQLKGTSNRSATESFLISFEHTFFNALKKKKLSGS